VSSIIVHGKETKQTHANYSRTFPPFCFLERRSGGHRPRRRYDSRLRQRMGAIAFIELMFLSMFFGESLDTGFDKGAGFAWTGIAVRLELSIS
jgi:hypothetical protein